MDIRDRQGIGRLYLRDDTYFFVSEAYGHAALKDFLSMISIPLPFGKESTLGWAERGADEWKYSKDFRWEPIPQQQVDAIMKSWASESGPMRRGTVTE